MLVMSEMGKSFHGGAATCFVHAKTITASQCNNLPTDLQQSYKLPGSRKVECKRGFADFCG